MAVKSTFSPDYPTAMEMRCKRTKLQGFTRCGVDVLYSVLQEACKDYRVAHSHGKCFKSLMAKEVKKHALASN